MFGRIKLFIREIVFAVKMAYTMLCLKIMMMRIARESAQLEAM